MKKLRIFVIVISLMVLAAVVAGFFIVGSPQKERLRRFDEQRVLDFQNLQGQIVSFWQSKNHLPSSLDELKNEISGFIPPLDPETNAAYEYRTIGPLSFELCATFSFASEESRPDLPVPATRLFAAPFSVWSHPSGRFCFQRTIDPELFGKKPPPISLQH